MRLPLISALAVASLCSCAEQTQPPPPYDVYFQIDAPDYVIENTRSGVALWNGRMGREIFVLHQPGELAPPLGCLVVIVGTRGDLLPGSLATADVSDPCLVKIVATPQIWPTSMAHELGHVLLGREHSDSGIMGPVNAERTVTDDDVSDVMARWDMR